MKSKKNILVFNVGSSSIKYSLFEDSKKIISEKEEKLKSKEDYKKAIEKIFKKFEDKKIDLIAHSVVHGGNISETSKITQNIKNQIKKFCKFAPLHNPKQLMTINLCEKFRKPQYAVFDTMFFSNLPEVARTYAIPKELTRKYNIKKYGFHGLSHKFVSRGLSGKTITCHLGAGCSISAILNENPIDTSMGLTPLDGILMATRAGNIDSGIIFLLQKKGYNVEDILTNKSGLKGVSGYEDFREILKHMHKDKDCKLAYELFVYKIINAIGSYAAVLNGLNNLVFTGAISENSSKLREDVCNHLNFLGIKLNSRENKNNKEVISSRFSKVKVYVKKTDEEQIAVEEVLRTLK